MGKISKYFMFGNVFILPLDLIDTWAVNQVPLRLCRHSSVACYIDFSIENPDPFSFYHFLGT